MTVETCHTGSTKGMVFDVQRASLLDGPGLRTTVFLKGCPLRCAWCHNPESQQPKPELAFRLDRCLQCRTCVDACEQGVHQFDAEGIHHIARADCLGCAQCVEQCPGDALQLFGREQTVDSIMETVMKDVAFYRQSGGGLTVSGGEPLYQSAFTLALLAAARAKDIHTCVETCGYVRKEILIEAAEWTDLFLYDVKAVDTKLHRRLTQVNNERILSNLQYLHDQGSAILLRCPLIPGENDSPEALEALAGLIRNLPQLKGVEVLPYHNTGRDKYERLGRKPLINHPTVERSQAEEWVATLRQQTGRTSITLSA